MKVKRKKVSVWLPGTLYEKAKKEAKNNYQSFARWLQQTIEEKLKKSKE